MKSNGFGSFTNRIIMRVDNRYAERAREALAAEVRNVHDDFTDIIWTRSSTKKRDDETIVYEAHMHLNIPNDSWHIIWEDSDY